jgi:hypothetical protein
VPIIRGFCHLNRLCAEFGEWYNGWRPHMTLDGTRPDDVYYNKAFKKLIFDHTHGFFMVFQIAFLLSIVILR